MGGPKNVPVRERFWSSVEKNGPIISGMDSPCYVWTRAKSSSGYGSLSVTVGGVRSTPSAHRLSWEIHHGPVPPGTLVCHRCDNPLCVRPEHLFLGTDLDNVADALAKGRRRRADPNRKRKREGKRRSGKSRYVRRFPVPRPLASYRHRAALSPEQVREIRTRHAAGGVMQTELAREFGVRKEAISKIIRRVRWRDV